jgi:hypothetical protein
MTLLHEIAHALLPQHVHNRVWKWKCREIGGTGERCSNRKIIISPYSIDCPKCHHQYPRFKMTKLAHRLDTAICRCVICGFRGHFTWHNHQQINQTPYAACAADIPPAVHSQPSQDAFVQMTTAEYKEKFGKRL